MLQFLVSIFGQAAVKEAAEQLSFELATSQHRKVFRRAIRDVIEDEITLFGFKHGIEDDVIKSYIDKHEGDLKDEIRARFDAILQGFKISR